MEKWNGKNKSQVNNPSLKKKQQFRIKWAKKKPYACFCFKYNTIRHNKGFLQFKMRRILPRWQKKFEIN